jgi:hypothetical protein
MENYSDRWTDEFLDQMRQHTDPLADDVVAQIISAGHVDDVNLIFHVLRDNQALKRDALPPVLRHYFEQAAVLPDWADPALLEKGAQYFGRYGLLISSLLNFKSLPSAYVCPHGAAVLHATGRLEEFKGSTAKFQRRIMETAQFVFNVSAPGAFKPGGQGIEDAMKVRLMHAAIRYYIRRDGHWDTAKLGQPINQEDMCGTMLSFSALTQEGLDQMKIPYDKALAEGYFHIWQVTGHLMGLRPELIPANSADGHKLGWQILNRNMGRSTAGDELRRALVDFTRGAIPFGLFKSLPEVFIRRACGDKIADLLNVRHYGWLRAKFLPWCFDKFVRKLVQVSQEDPLAARVSALLSRHILQHTINHYYQHKKVEFNIPPSLRKEWNLKTAVDDAGLATQPDPSHLIKTH